MMPFKSRNISFDACRHSASCSSPSYALHNLKKSEILNCLNTFSTKKLKIEKIPHRVGSRHSRKTNKSNFLSYKIPKNSNSSLSQSKFSDLSCNHVNFVNNKAKPAYSNYTDQNLMFNKNEERKREKNATEREDNVSSLSIASTAADSRIFIPVLFSLNESSVNYKERVSKQQQSFKEKARKRIKYSRILKANEDREIDDGAHNKFKEEEMNEGEVRREASLSNFHESSINSCNVTSSQAFPSSVVSLNSFCSTSFSCFSEEESEKGAENVYANVSCDRMALDQYSDDQEKEGITNEQLNAINIIDTVMRNVFMYNRLNNSSSSLNSDFGLPNQDTEECENQDKLSNSNNVYACYDEIYTFDRLKERLYFYCIEDDSVCKNDLLEAICRNSKIMNYRHIIIDYIMRLSYAVIKIVKQPLRRCTVHLAISILDKYILLNLLKTNDISTEKIENNNNTNNHSVNNNNNNNKNIFNVLLTNIPERVAACVLHIAMKMEEPNGQSILCAFNSNINISKIISLEEKILKEISSNSNNVNQDYYSCFNSPLSIDFAHFVLYKLGYNMHKNNNDVELAAYLLDLFSYSPMCVHTLPSKVACAAVKLMRHIRHPFSSTKLLWPNYIRNLTGYNRGDLKNIILEMNQILRNTEKYEGAMMLHKGGWAEMVWK